ncbi:glycoside hydrolase family 32 protein [Lacihabitans sp. LS3-19]|uniref:glycoside hydrolase family 32 protein n=1 Tax=Lacihabitans sp. LS3-19 TaxID=2487335 RepID=UPI0020CCD7CC|nr:glycoside hydrolase family 32 protein [Lacihabitans sp. LS3-19]MCP9767259.1 glycoside hydrolase family 32 protein [Lacihabitans sp. LS3-19]
MNIKVIALFILSIGMYSCTKKNSETRKMDEKYRPQIHFTPEAKWMNDPNGMVYFEGEYHLFYQYYPDSTVWGPMHWGHAVSPDLVHWEHLPVAIYPDSLGWIFSGSAVIDWNNTTKLGKDGKPAMIAIYTYHNSVLEKEGRNDFQYQGLAYSLDKGRTWTKYEKNPVLPNPGIRDFRDPKVSWDEEHKKWIMILAVVDHTEIYSSDDLLSWKKESEFGKNLGAHGGVWECPDLFPMKDPDGQSKWVMLVSVNPGAPNGGSGTQYFVGDFDGHTFVTTQKDAKWMDYGKDNYAGVTWSDVPKSDGRRLFLGWMNNWQYARDIPTGIWRGAGTLPRSLDLVSENGDYFIASHPVAELEKLIENTEEIAPLEVKGISPLKKDIKLPMTINLTYNNISGNVENFGLILSNDNNEQVKIGYDKIKKAFFVDNTLNGWQSPNKDFAIISYAPYVLKTGKVNLRLFLDRSSLELFADDDKVVFTNQFFSSEQYSKIEAFSQNGEVKLSDIKINTLKRIW